MSKIFNTLQNNFSHSIYSLYDLKEGDHIYVWLQFGKIVPYTHHGIVTRIDLKNRELSEVIHFGRPTKDSVDDDIQILKVRKNKLFLMKIDNNQRIL